MQFQMDSQFSNSKKEKGGYFLNHNSIISKFIDNFGPLEPKPHLHYIQGGVKGRFGLTTEPGEVLQLWRQRFYRENQKYPTLQVSSPSDILPRIHQEYDKWFFEFDEKDLLQAMRILQNKPFSKIKVIHSPEPLPMIFQRQDVGISVLLAPIMLELPKPEDQKIQKEHFKGNPWRDGKPKYYWTQQLPNSTFWIVEFPTYSPESDGLRYGFPIGKTVKCRNCGLEIDKQTWINKLNTMNHPECPCSCDTYDDFCGCRRRREMATYDRIRRESTIKKHFMRNHWDMA
jgi:hypothetical protein